MSVRTAGVLLFVTAFVALPLPFFGLDGTLVPAARYGQLAAVLLGLLAHEGGGGAVGLLVLLFVAHAVLYTGLLALVAWVLARGVLRHLGARGCRILVVATSVSLLVVASQARIYDSPFHHSDAHARLLELYR